MTKNNGNPTILCDAVITILSFCVMYFLHVNESGFLNTHITVPLLYISSHIGITSSSGSVFLSICRPHLSYLSIHLSVFVCLPIHLPAHLSICPSVLLFVTLRFDLFSRWLFHFPWNKVFFDPQNRFFWPIHVYFDPQISQASLLFLSFDPQNLWS